MDIREVIDEASPCGVEELKEFGRILRSNHSAVAVMASLLGQANLWAASLASLETDSIAEVARLQGQIKGVTLAVEALLTDIDKAEARGAKAEPEELIDFEPEE